MNKYELAREAQKLVTTYICDDADFFFLHVALMNLVRDFDCFDQTDILKYAICAIYEDDPTSYGDISEGSAIAEVADAIAFSSAEYCVNNFAKETGIEKDCDAFLALREFTSPEEWEDKEYKKQRLSVLIKALQEAHDSL